MNNLSNNSAQRRKNNATTNADNNLQDLTPESDSLDLLGYQSPAEAFIQSLAGLVNQSDVETMIRAQKQMLQRFEKTNEMLLNCNALSQSRLKSANDDFKKHVKLLTEMKKDLDYIFRKIRIIKNKLSQQYPVAYSDAQPQRSSLAEEAEDEAETSHAAVVRGTQAMQVSVHESRKPLPAAEEGATNSDDKKASAVEQRKSTTVEYVQMEEAIENGKPIENELIKRVCSIETANPNDSSDCTSEDTG